MERLPYFTLVPGEVAHSLSYRMTVTYLCMQCPTDLDVSIHGDANSHPYADDNRQEEEWIADVGKEHTECILALYIRLDHFDAVRQVEKHQHTNIRYRLRNEVISGGGPHGLPVPD